jgi:hypothetical protein
MRGDAVPLPLSAVMDEVAARGRRRTRRSRLAAPVIALLAAGIASGAVSAGGRAVDVPAPQPVISRIE